MKAKGDDDLAVFFATVSAVHPIPFSAAIMPMASTNLAKRRLFMVVLLAGMGFARIITYNNGSTMQSETSVSSSR
jgi:hypothetical protein